MRRNVQNKMKRNLIYGILLLLMSGCVVSCGRKVPRDVIQPEAMEDLLYDYHLASLMSADLDFSEKYKREAYLEYVFEKHHVTEEKFDSSMVWYTRHTDQLVAVYANLKQRFETARGYITSQGGNPNAQIAVSFSGDSVDIWQDRTVYWLSATPYSNKIVFNLQADTTFNSRDILELSANFSFFPQKSVEGKAVMGLCFYFKNDSTYGMTRTVTASGPQVLRVQQDSLFDIRNISGFIYYTKSSEDNGSVLLNDIRLMRYRAKTRPDVFRFGASTVKDN